MDSRTSVPGGRRDEARQRWRLVLRRSPDAPPLGPREQADAWAAAALASGLPVAGSDATPPRPKLVLAAPLSARAAAEADLADLFLTDRLPAWRVREALDTVVPEGWALVDLRDTWVGGPALAALVVAADYRIALAPVDAIDIERAVKNVLAAASLPRDRPKGGSTARYDLRPLIAGLALADAGPPPTLTTRTRFDPERGVGRPEEVIAVLGDVVGKPLEATSVVRERLILSDDGQHR
ncbi:MAG: DUF2344 domain-containing protein [Chloroflexota bacterium]